jgi:DNA processing protein
LACRNEREIFAVPGRPHEPKSAGCNYLIRTHQAKLIESATDIATALRWDEAAKPRAIQTQLLLDLDPAETELINIIRSNPEIQVDQLTIASGLSPGTLAASILSLEFRGVVKTLPGKRYTLLG